MRGNLPSIPSVLLSGTCYRFVEMSSLRTIVVLTIGSILTFALPALAVTSGELYRTAPLGFGKFEARLQFASGDGVVSSFFLWKDGSERSDVYWNELDFEKLGATCDLQSNSIFGLPQTNHEDKGYRLTGLCDGYHTYTYEWTPEYIAWSVDGAEIRRDTGSAATAYAENAPEGMQMRFNVWPGDASFGGNFDENILPVHQFIAWAQYSEYTPGAGDDGSDFTLSWREEFDSKPAGWSMGSWESPLGHSTHNASNVVFTDGVAVIALTADDLKGYTGTPPEDDPTILPVGPDEDGGGSDGGLQTQPSAGCNFAPGTERSIHGSTFSLLLAALAGFCFRLKRGTKGTVA
jgi:endo-1,3-1,4-beta-glycanase ExoK